MTEFEQRILRQLASLEREIRELRSASPSAAQAFEDLPPASVVGKAYVAYRFGISERAVLRGEQGTNQIRRVSGKPLKFIKREVDAAWESRKKKPVGARAADERAKAKKRIYSVIKK